MTLFANIENDLDCNFVTYIYLQNMNFQADLTHDHYDKF